MPRLLASGDVVIATFPEHVPPGHEQRGYRPAIVVGLAETLDTPHFPVILVTPVTTDRGQGWASRSPLLYPRLPAGSARLPANSLALLDQTRFLGLDRVSGFLGTLAPALFRPIRDGLRQMIG